MTAEAAAFAGACAPVPPRICSGRTPRDSRTLQVSPGSGGPAVLHAERASGRSAKSQRSESSLSEATEDSDDGAELQEVRVSSLAGPVCTLTMDPGEPVSMLKKSIEASTGTKAVLQRLVAGTCELYDTDQVPRNVIGGGPVEVMMIRRTKEEAEWLVTVTNSWTRFLAAPRDIRGDYEVALAAVEQKGSLLNYTSEELRSDRRMVFAAVRNDGNALQYASEALRDDRDVVLEAVRTDGRALGYAGPDVRADREVVSAAIRCQPCALQYADERLRDDRELALLAVRIDGSALRYAGKQVRKDVEVVVAAINSKRKAFRFSMQEVRMHPDVLAAMGLDPD